MDLMVKKAPLLSSCAVVTAVRFAALSVVLLQFVILGQLVLNGID